MAINTTLIVQYIDNVFYSFITKPANLLVETKDNDNKNSIESKS